MRWSLPFRAGKPEKGNLLLSTSLRQARMSVKIDRGDLISIGADRGGETKYDLQ